MTKAISKPEWQKYFDYLDKLRESGRTNMFGAGAYLERDFLLSRSEAHQVLQTWMTEFSE